MAENETSLDAFVTTSAPEPQQNTDVPQNNSAETINLEDEFAKLLNDFIGQSAKPTNTAPASSGTVQNTAPTASSGLDSFITPQNNSASKEPQSGGLDSFITSQNNTSSSGPSAGGLDSFITPAASVENNVASTSELNSLITEPSAKTEQESASEENSALKAEEFELARAISNFQDGIYSIADKKNLKVPETDYNEEMLRPNYKPSVGKKIAQYMLSCWDVINKADPENMKRLSKSATDEEYLAFAETLTDTDMQLAIISYVEILINLEICEVKYEQKKEIIQKNRIKKELYEEYMELQERKSLFIQKLKEKNFPIDADRLIGNYFRVAQKDPDGSFEALVKNPAMFSPIEFDKIRPKFFGLIKVTPEDGIKANQKIGKFIKNLKV